MEWDCNGARTNSGEGGAQERRKPPCTYWLGPNDGLAAGIGAHARQRAERVVRQYVDTAVVGLEVVDLLLEDESPEVLAEEFDDVECVVEAWPVA